MHFVQWPQKVFFGSFFICIFANEQTKNRMKHWAIILMLAAVAATSCGRNEQEALGHRGVYHWKTTYDPSEWEKEWMAEHKVDRLYVKLFDVEAGQKAGEPDWKMVPIATTQFRQELPKEMEVVPVVYITVDAIRNLENTDWERDYYDLYAKLLVKRIDDMMAAHYGGEVREMQIDCDWTQQTRESYFKLAREMKELLHKRGIRLSGTLRLHQLREVGIGEGDGYYDTDTLPFDRSLLMCYNTGRLQEAGTANSILDYDDVKPYLAQYEPEMLPRTDSSSAVWRNSSSPSFHSRM